MASRRPPRHYWDSCVFLYYLEDHPRYAGDIAIKLDEARAGNVEIVTSVGSIAEVAFVAREKENRRLDPETESLINELWSASSPITLAEVTAPIASEAQKLMRTVVGQGMKHLKPMDAIHLSTAARLRAAHFDTYDEPLDRYQDLVPFSIGPVVVTAAPLFERTDPSEEDES